MQTTHIPGAWLSVIWIHFGGITQICSQANDSLCDARMSQQPSPYIIDGSNSNVTLSCNVVGATEFLWSYKSKSGPFSPVPCLNNFITINTCTYKPTLATADNQVRCSARFPSDAVVDVFCTLDIQVAACDVRIPQQPSPYIIDGSNSNVTLTCNVVGATEFLWSYKSKSGPFSPVPCLNNFITINTCTYKPTLATADNQVRCSARFPSDAVVDVFCTLDIQLAACDVRITQQPSPYIIDGSNSTMTLTCNVVGAIEFSWAYHVSGVFYRVKCQETIVTTITCTYLPLRNTTNLEVRCQATFANKAPENVYCTPNIQVAACDVRITQQPSPYFMDGSNSTLTLTSNVAGATEFVWSYNRSGNLVGCSETNIRVNTCTYRPTHETANQLVRCIAYFATNDTNVFCTPNIQCYCNATNTGNRKVFVSQQTAPFVIDGSDSPITLTCHAQNSTDSTEYTWKDQTGVLKHCQETTPRSRTCTFPLGVGESQDPVTCSVVTAGATAESASCVPVVKIVTTTTNPTTPTSTTTTVSTLSPSTSQSSSTSFGAILGSAMAAVVALIVVMVVVISKRRVPVPQRRISEVQRNPEPQVPSTGQTYPQEPDTNLEDSISTIVSTQSEASSTGPEDSNVDTDHS